MKELEKYIKDGITIRKTDHGYNVFTIPTQHFEVESLDMLTVEAFEEAIKNQLDLEDLQAELIAEKFKRLSAEEIIKILDDNMDETEFAHYYDYEKMTKLLGESEEVFNGSDEGDIIIVRYFKEHGVYIMVEGWAMSSYDFEFDSGFIEVIPEHKVKKTFKIKQKDNKPPEDLPF